MQDERRRVSLQRMIQICLAVLMTILVLSVTLQLLSRHLRIALVWTEEVAKIAFVWLALLAAGVAMAKGMHISVGILSTHIRQHTARILFIFSNLIAVVFFGIMTFQGIRFAASVGTHETAALRLSMAIPYSAIPVGSAIIAWYAVRNLTRRVRSLPGRSEDQ